MTCKEFFKSVSFKCISVLLGVLLVSGVLLTVAYGFLQVSDKDRTERAISKIYGESKTPEKVEVKDENAKQGSATIIEAYKIEGNYLVKSKGKGGFGGTVTCWVRIDIKNGAISKVNKVVVEGSDGETQLNLINFLDKFDKTDYTDGFKYLPDSGFITSGSTLSSTAIDNAVNGAVDFVRVVGLGGAVEDPYKDFLYHGNIDMKKTSWTRNGDVIDYNIVTNSYGHASPFTVTVAVGADKKISAYSVKTNGSTDGFEEGMNSDIKNGSWFVGKGIEELKSALSNGDTFPDESNVVIKTGASRSNTLCVCAAAFATANYEYIKNLVLYKDSIDMDKTSWVVEGTDVKYTIVTSGYSPADPFTITLTVGADKKISAYSVKTNGSTDGFEEGMNSDIKNGSWFVGKGIEELKSALSNGDTFPDESNVVIKTGASRSNTLCVRAAIFAAANYDYCLNTPKGGQN